LQASRDSVNWTTIWASPDEVTDNDWIYQEYDISSIADNQPVVYIRFTMGPTNLSMTYCGWNIDDFAVTAHKCESCPVLIEITTDVLPAFTVGYHYGIQLTAIGGAGQYTWSDKYSDLAGSGLTLSSSGLLSGTPSSPGFIEFTAFVNDAYGCDDEKVLGIEILSIFCGDANGDGTANVGDAVFMINYIFKGGPAPDPVCSGDANGDDNANVGDAVYMINYVFKGGPGPLEGCCR
jgi:hypothetical protein